jgi:hypothetical protein
MGVALSTIPAMTATASSVAVFLPQLAQMAGLWRDHSALTSATTALTITADVIRDRPSHVCALVGIVGGCIVSGRYLRDLDRQLRQIRHPDGSAAGSFRDGAAAVAVTVDEADGVAAGIVVETPTQQRLRQLRLTSAVVAGAYVAFSGAIVLSLISADRQHAALMARLRTSELAIVADRSADVAAAQAVMNQRFVDTLPLGTSFCYASNDTAADVTVRASHVLGPLGGDLSNTTDACVLRPGWVVALKSNRNAWGVGKGLRLSVNDGPWGYVDHASTAAVSSLGTAVKA